MPAPSMPPVVGFGSHTSAIGELVTSVYAAGSSAQRLGDPNDPSPGVASIPAIHDRLSVKALSNVVSIDRESGTALIQGCCPFTRAVATLVPRGLMPTVTPSPAGRTIAGAITRTSVGAASFAAGPFGASVRELELMEPSGQVITVAPGGPGAARFAQILAGHGPTQAFIVAARVAVRPAGDFVVTRTVGAPSAATLTEMLTVIARTGSWEGVPVEFAEAVTRGPAVHAINLGRMVSAAEAPLHQVNASRYDRSGPPYAATLVPGATDLLTMADYLTRWESDGFWRSFHYGLSHRWVRRLWPPALRTAAAYSRLDALVDGRNPAQAFERVARWRPASPRVFREVTVPLASVGDLLESLAGIVPGVPVWTVPFRNPDAEGWSAYCGIWGSGAHQRTGHNVGAENAIDRMVAGLSGRTVRFAA